MEKLLEVNNLKTYFYTDKGVMPAVDGLDFHLKEGEVLAIVGESGCGKSVSSMSLINMVPYPGKIVDGEILYMGENLLQKPPDDMRKLRGSQLSIIFQDPISSLNPAFKIGRQIMETMIHHKGISKAQAKEEAILALSSVGIPDPIGFLQKYPHELSGGMCQRVMIAIALCCNPKILIADEPTTALDVTIQAQILRLLKSLKKETGTSIILITHDMGVVAGMADRVLVMYAGQAVEEADVNEIFENPKHPYTIGLLNAIPNPDDNTEALYNIKGTVPSIGEYPDGCRFAPRCDMANEGCEKNPPELYEAGSGHFVRCLRHKLNDNPRLKPKV
ncbi:MAG: ABC transporter ATP-binding protein [Defluviitaleaceae bacterium]|nr:ABC transporter ATP-binding protein [Defluviitaleaceae bacterium]